MYTIFPSTKYIKITLIKKTQTYMSDHEFKPFHKNLRVTISSIKYSKGTNTDQIALHINYNSPYKITAPLGILEYC